MLTLEKTSIKFSLPSKLPTTSWHTGKLLCLSRNHPPTTQVFCLNRLKKKKKTTQNQHYEQTVKNLTVLSEGNPSFSLKFKS